ncbi:hypothetical protein A2U01_0060371, partial [Trifolium medium]|nr:hypothetical protein [Trifolium medium]
MRSRERGRSWWCVRLRQSGAAGLLRRGSGVLPEVMVVRR